MKLGNAGRTIRAGVIGLGNRSKEQIRCLVAMADVEVVVVCDVYEDRVKATQDAIESQKGARPEGTCDTIFIVTPSVSMTLPISAMMTFSLGIPICRARSACFLRCLYSPCTGMKNFGFVSACMSLSSS